MKVLISVAACALVLLVGELAHLQLLASLWIPLTMLLFLAGFPLLAVVGKNSLFWGLFDLDLSLRLRLPIRHFVATLSAFAVASSAISIAELILHCGPSRMAIPGITASAWIMSAYHRLSHVFGNSFILVLIVVNAITAYFVIFAIATSWSQDKSRRPLARLIAGVLLGLLTGTVVILAIKVFATPAVVKLACATKNMHLVRCLGPGYGGNLWADHLGAALACLVTLVLYMALGFYGRWALGKVPTVAALVGPLMVLLVLGWVGSALQFYLSRWHIPLLLVAAVLGWINNKLPWADHTYDLLPRDCTPAAPPHAVLTFGDRTCAILVASAGGGIQAAAWTAKVLAELHKGLGPKFDRALCFISSISGGSMGSAFYLDWMERGAPEGVAPEGAAPGGAPDPFTAASASSLDEVAWGLAWPDLLRVLLPWPFRMDRALAMERAWVGNAGSPTLNSALSNWNGPTASGELPALIMNSTMVEVGGPLLLGTSDVNGVDGRVSYCWWDGDDLHVYNRSKLDVPIVRAARLSATFPFVTPAARPVHADHEPHMMDGGFYDNYGMATLTEWLDQALEEESSKKTTANQQVKRVMVLQVNGFPKAVFDPPTPPAGRGGWFLQLIDPIRILVNVRTAGQVSHRDIELALLEEKWRIRGVHIEHVNFEPTQADAPLSWHLMPKQKANIETEWATSEEIKESFGRVRGFLEEHPEA